MDAQPFAQLRTAPSPAVAALQEQLAGLIWQGDLAVAIGLQSHSISAGARYRHLGRVKIGRRTYFRVAEVAELLEARDQAITRRAILAPPAP